MSAFTIRGNVVDIQDQRIYADELKIEGEKIASIIPINGEAEGFIITGIIDSHAHIDSSMLIPSEFAMRAVIHGNVDTVSDPHVIANVCGIEGVRYIILNGNAVLFKYNIGAGSCVLAT